MSRSEQQNHSIINSILGFFQQPTVNISRQTVDHTKSDFLNSLVHELKTPLNALVSFSEILQHEIRNPLSASECIDYAKEINQAALSLNELIHDLLDVESIRSGNFSIDLSKEIDVVDIIKRSIRLNYAYALRRHIRIESEIDPNIKLAKLDAKRLKQIITNIISNSIKYSPSDTLIRVIASQKDQKLQIKIIDQGFGMDKEQLVKAFEKYQTINNPNTGSVDSFGLGLPITKELVEKQNGTIQIKSQPGIGTEVTLIF